MNKSSSIAFVAGRSGGHIIPALTLAHTLLKNKDRTILFFTTDAPLDKKIIHDAGAIINYHIPLHLNNFSGNPLLFIVFMWQLLCTTITSYRWLRKTHPESIVSMGGYISLPVCLAARFLKIPVDVYELNATPGRSLKVLAPLARTIYHCFEQTKNYLPASKCSFTSYPIRFEPESKHIRHADALKKLGLHPNKKTLFIQGGSQGSVAVNNHMKQWLDLNSHLHALIQVIHQTGSQDKTNWAQIYSNYDIPAVVFEYRDDLATCYAAADFIISRAGAGALFEILFFNKPCLLIPLQIATTTHQMDNARAATQLHPQLFTVLTEIQIKTDNMLLFTTLNKHIYNGTFSYETVIRPLHS